MQNIILKNGIEMPILGFGVFRLIIKNVKEL